MRYRFHESFGIALWIVFLVFFILSYPQNYVRLIVVALVGFCFCFLGSIFPDIDNKKSRVYKRARFMLAIAAFVIFFTGLAVRFPQNAGGVILLIAACGLLTAAVILVFNVILPKHRGATHSFVAAVIYLGASFVLSYIVLFDLPIAAAIAIFSFLSYSSHLILDSV